MRIIRRLFETLVITVIASVPAYILIKCGFVANTNSARGIMYALSACVFYLLHLYVLRKHLIAVGKTSVYLAVNFGIWALHGALCVIVKKYVGISVYETFFGFTSMFCYLYFPRKLSVTLIYLAYAAEIIFFPLDRWILYRYYLTDRDKKKLAEQGRRGK